MFVNVKIVSVVAAAALGVYAQSSSGTAEPPTSTAGISPCIIQCSTEAATANGCSSLYVYSHSCASFGSDGT